MQQAGLDLAISQRDNATLGGFPHVGEYPEGQITIKPDYGLGLATKLAELTGTDPWTGLKLGLVMNTGNLCFLWESPILHSSGSEPTMLPI